MKFCFCVFINKERSGERFKKKCYNQTVQAQDFIREFQRLYRTTPQISHWTRQSENCDYGDIIVVSRNCYLCFWSSNLENCFYCHESRKNRFCGDLNMCEDCELCYECIDCSNCYNSNFLQDCKQCTDCSYGYGLIGCNNCFGCAGLRRKEFHIFNKPYSKEAYAEKLAEIKKWPAQKTAEEKVAQPRLGVNGLASLWLGLFEKVKEATPRVFMHQLDNENSFGDYLHHSKNCYWCFDSYLCEDSMYIFNANLERGTKDCIDCGPIANTFERCYDIAFCGYMFDCLHTYWCDYLYNCEWIINGWDLNHCFGCVYVKNKEYLFLNKPISKEEYEKVTSRLKKELAQLGIRDLYGLVHYK